MWIMTKYGFFSIVCAWKSEDNQDPDTNQVMVRARNKEHLFKLAKRFPGQLGKLTVAWYKATDYPYRMFMPKETWEQVMRQLVLEMDYTNFKNEVAEQFPIEGWDDYQDFLHAVWAHGLSLQSS